MTSFVFPWDALRSIMAPLNMQGLIGTVLLTLALIAILWGLHQFFSRIRRLLGEVVGPIASDSASHRPSATTVLLHSPAPAWVSAIRFRKLELVPALQVVRFLRFLNKIVYMTAVLLVVLGYGSWVFSLFDATRGMTYLLGRQIQVLLAFGLRSGVAYLPKLLSIALILLFGLGLLRFLKVILEAIAQEEILFVGFHREWADPTYKIVRFLIMLLALVMVFPLLPGFNSPAFKGISVFLGVLLSLGSTSAIANIVAGMVLIYMRSFDVGDRIHNNGVTGDIIEKTLLMTRIRTPNNEVVTVPNATMLSHPTLNYSEEAATRGLILHTTVTIGYDVPWPTVHALLCDAALDTPSILSHPPPVVYQKSLDDFYVSYELRATTRDANHMARIYSDLHARIQTAFQQKGIEMLSPHYEATRSGPSTLIAPSAVEGSADPKSPVASS